MHTLTRVHFVISLIVTFGTIVNCQYEGESCYHERDAANGICKQLHLCKTAIDDLSKKLYPQNCGFQGSAAIVCCVEKTPTTTTTTTTTTTSKPIVIDIPSGPLPVGEKSKIACKAYQELAYKMQLSPVLTDTGYEKVENCPWDPVALTVIIDGEDTIKGEFPHMALIGYGTWPTNYAWKCGGSLISEKFVLTASHCLFARGYGEPKFVRLGDIDYAKSDDDQHVQQIDIKVIHKHPDYKFPVNYNDIALFELEKPANLNIYVKPICLYTKSTTEPIGIITGWGNTELGEPSENLLKAVVGSFSHDQCKITFANDRRSLPRGLDDNLQICYGSSKNSKDTCQGDSGGPIQVYAKDVFCSYYIFGVTSFGKGCGHQNIPAVYVRVSAYIEWIEKLVWP